MTGCGIGSIIKRWKLRRTISLLLHDSVNVELAEHVNRDEQSHFYCVTGCGIGSIIKGWKLRRTISLLLHDSVNVELAEHVNRDEQSHFYCVTGCGIGSSPIKRWDVNPDEQSHFYWMTAWTWNWQNMSVETSNLTITAWPTAELAVGLSIIKRRKLRRTISLLLHDSVNVELAEYINRDKQPHFYCMTAWMWNWRNTSIETNNLALVVLFRNTFRHEVAFNNSNSNLNTTKLNESIMLQQCILNDALKNKSNMNILHTFRS